jgi:hypothetical protein
MNNRDRVMLKVAVNFGLKEEDISGSNKGHWEYDNSRRFKGDYNNSVKWVGEHSPESTPEQIAAAIKEQREEIARIDARDRTWRSDWRRLQSAINEYIPNKIKRDSNLLDPSTLFERIDQDRQENWSKYQAARNADIDAREQAQAAEGIARKRDERINPLLARAKNDSNLLDPSKVKNEGGPTMAFRVRQILDKLKGNRMAQTGIGAGVGGLAGAGISAALGGGRGANTLAALLGAGALGTAGYMYGDKAHQYLSDAAKKYIGA